jgi:hypothetical protein
MVSFEAATEQELTAYNGDFDRVLAFDSDEALRIIQLAAKAHMRYLSSQGQVPSRFYEGVQGIDPHTKSMMMNPSYVRDYCGMLESYANVAFLYVDLEDGMDFDECRYRARTLSKDIDEGSRAFEVFGAIDVATISSHPQHLYDLIPEPRTPIDAGTDSSPPSIMNHFWRSSLGRAIFRLCET